MPMKTTIMRSLINELMTSRGYDVDTNVLADTRLAIGCLPLNVKDKLQKMFIRMMCSQMMTKKLVSDQ